MLRTIGVIFCLVAIVLAASGCGGGASVVPPIQPQPLPTPAPTGSVTISSLSPNSVPAGMPSLTLAVNGVNLDLRHDGSHQTNTVALWTAGTTQTSLSTTIISSTQLTIAVPRELVAEPVQVRITIEKWYFMDDTPFAVSNSIAFAVTAAVPLLVPAASTLGTNGTLQFAATGFANNADIVWSIEEGAAGGVITSNGLYTAPDSGGTFHISAKSSSMADSTASAQVIVTDSGFMPTGSMHVARTGHTATLLKDGRVLIAGGGDGTAELFDPTTGTFSVTSPPLSGRLYATATLLADGRVLIAGGLGLTPGPDGHLSRLGTAEIFDPASGTFRGTISMIQTRRNHTATALPDGRVLVAGGYFDAICTTASAELFDPTTGTFSSTGSMNTERVFHTASLLKSGEVLMVGGSNGCAPDAPDDPPWDPLFAETYKAKADSFLVSGGMSTTRIGHVAVLLPDGKVLVLGGIPAIQNLHDQPPNPAYAELYDPTASMFSPVPGLAISFQKYTATLLPTGIILIVGGEDSAAIASPEVQLLDPNAGVVAPTRSLGSARVGHTATLLQDGRVLITGGTDAQGNALATAELYK